jgi:hypothetical protein
MDVITPVLSRCQDKCWDHPAWAHKSINQTAGNDIKIYHIPDRSDDIWNMLLVSTYLHKKQGRLNQDPEIIPTIFVNPTCVYLKHRNHSLTIRTSYLTTTYLPQWCNNNNIRGEYYQYFSALRRPIKLTAWC